MHAVAQLVRQRHHVARLAQVVQQHVGVRRRHRRMREGARRLARPHRRVDPALVEERPAISAMRRARSRDRRRARSFSPRPRGSLRSSSSGSGALRSQNCELVEAQPLRLQRVVAVRQPRIGRAHRVDQRLDHLGLDVVGQVRGRSACRLKLRQRSSISLSLASVLVISAKSRSFAANVPPAPRRRLALARGRRWTGG